MSTERHWRAGEKLPPADWTPHEPDERGWTAAVDLHRRQIAEAQRAAHVDLDRLARGAIWFGVLCSALGIIVGALMTWLAMR